MRIADVSRELFLSEFERYIFDTLSDCEGKVGEAMRYAVLDGGKRVRPLSVFLGAKAAGGNAELTDVLALAAAIELIHSYSLVHDDMPEMDNDDYRRGKPSAHRQFGAATALLAGDGLLTLAGIQGVKANVRASQEILKAALDMVYGQSRELEGCKGESEWLNMYALKTGALIRGAFRAGAICAGADERRLADITEFAECIGLGFQLSDDLLDNDASIVNVIGAKRAETIKNERFDLACNIAQSFADSAQIIAFAKELQFRNI